MIMFGRYFQNEDTTSISYKQYNWTPNDKYPTFSVCLDGNRLHWYNDDLIFDNYGTTPSIYDINGFTSAQYSRMLSGEIAWKYEYDVTSRLYRKLPIVIANASDSSPSRYHLKISDVFDEIAFKMEPKQNSSYYGSDTTHTKHNATDDMLFYIGYENPGTICFTRKTNDALKSIRIYDLLSLNAKLLSDSIYNEGDVQIFIHYPGQLLRSLDSPSFSSSLSKYNWNMTLEVRNFQATVLRKRPDSNYPCNYDIGDHDIYVQSSISKDLGCIPGYWMEKLPKTLQLDECTSPDKLKEAYQYVQNYRATLAKYPDPCTEMYASTTFNWQETKGSEKSLIKIIYKERYYEEIHYSKGFNPESLLSNVGGFVGIFLGYSMMQLPELAVVIVGLWSKAQRRFLISNRIEAGNFSSYQTVLRSKIKIIGL